MAFKPSNFSNAIMKAAEVTFEGRNIVCEAITPKAGNISVVVVGLHVLIDDGEQELVITSAEAATRPYIMYKSNSRNGINGFFDADLEDDSVASLTAFVKSCLDAVEFVW
jgi:hypothetical protein